MSDPRQGQSFIQRQVAQARGGPPRRWVWFLAGAATSALAIKLYDDNSRLGLSWRIARRVMLGPSSSESGEKWQWKWKWKGKPAEPQEEAGDVQASVREDETRDSVTSKTLGSDEEGKGTLADVKRRALDKFGKAGEGLQRINIAVDFGSRGKKTSTGQEQVNNDDSSQEPSKA